MSVVWIADDSDILCSRPDYIFCFKDGVARLKISPFWSFMTESYLNLQTEESQIPSEIDLEWPLQEITPRIKNSCPIEMRNFVAFDCPIDVI